MSTGILTNEPRVQALSKTNSLPIKMAAVITHQWSPDPSLRIALAIGGWRLKLLPRDVSVMSLIQQAPSVLLIDMSLPDNRAWELLETFQKTWGAFALFPVFGLFAGKPDPARLIKALDLGAEDLLSLETPAELFLARIRATSRIYARRRPAKNLSSPNSSVQLQLESRRVLVHSIPTEPLAPKEFALLQLMLMRPDHVWTREALLDIVWGKSGDVFPRTVDKHIETLRQKLGPAAPFVQTVSGAGYRFNEEAAQ